MARPVIFLDDGGVMNDPVVRRQQWAGMVGAFFVPKLGGTPQAWSAANAQVITRIAEAGSWQERLRASPDYASFDRQYHLDWLRWMCELVGVPAPEDEECVVLARAAYRHITPRVRAAFPGAVAAIRTLHGKGYELHTASGESSAELDGYLKGMDVRACFQRLYGPDLINTFKDGPRFYKRLFSDAGVVPQDALVVDDNAGAARWANQVGARTVLINSAAPFMLSGTNPMLCLGSLAELPALVERLS